MNKLLFIFKNRNSLFVIATIIGLSFDKYAHFFKNYTLLILAIVMTFSIMGISSNIFKNVKSLVSVTFHSIFLNYILFGVTLLTLANLMFQDKELFMGFVVVAATPPGIVIIPFTFNFKGDIDYSFKGIIGVYIMAIFITPLIIGIFSEDLKIDTLHILYVIGKLILIPLIISRFLRHKKIVIYASKLRSFVIDYGFAIIIYTAISLNKSAIFSDISILFKSAIIFVISMFFLEKFYVKLFKNKFNKQKIISHSLMISLKSSGFAIATALTFVGEKAAIPASILSVFVLIYLIYKSYDFKKVNS